jgi:hypothetical protein
MAKTIQKNQAYFICNNSVCTEKNHKKCNSELRVVLGDGRNADEFLMVKISPFNSEAEFKEIDENIRNLYSKVNLKSCPESLKNKKTYLHPSQISFVKKNLFLETENFSKIELNYNKNHFLNSIKKTLDISNESSLIE